MDMESLAYDIKRVLRKLDGRKERILKMWYWLDWYKKLDIEEIAYNLWLTTAAVRQQKQKALEIIRDEIIPELLKKYL
jgi:DNA-directed RNA polymerase sigma subunit (sigma70/sigma32)